MNSLILVPLILGVASIARTSNPEPNTGARILFERMENDYGSITEHGDGRCTFIYTNTGDAPLVITACRSSCGCLVPNWHKEPLMPGQRDSIMLRYDTHRIGPFRKSVTVESNAVDQPTVILRIKGEVTPNPQPSNVTE